MQGGVDRVAIRANGEGKTSVHMRAMDGRLAVRVPKRRLGLVRGLAAVGAVALSASLVGFVPAYGASNDGVYDDAIGFALQLRREARLSDWRIALDIGGITRACSDVASAQDVSAQSAVDSRSAAQVGELLQLPEYPAGCEPVSLTIVLRSLGFEADPSEVIEGYLPVDPTSSDYVHEYGGSVYVDGGTMPPAIVTAANAYLADQGDAADGLAARDITGTTYAELLDLVEQGYPVLAWTTMYMGEPQFTGFVQEGYEWYYNEHCVVLYGIEGDEVLVSDPLEGLVRRDAAEFGRLYETCGCMAVVIDADQ